MSKRKFLSIVIPVYNEEKRLEGLEKVSSYLQSRNFSSELILVNDGSTDNTPRRLKNLSKRISIVKIVSYKENRGKGFAIKTGILEAIGKYRLFTDIDLSTPIEEFDKFFPHLAKHDVVIGSRKRRGARLLVRQPLLRESLGQGFTLLSQALLQLPLSDFTCGFKCFSQRAAEKIFSRQKIERWGFDAEVLFIAKKMGFSIKEVPVSWKNDSQTKVRLPQDIITSLSELIKVRYNDLKKAYV